MSTPEQEPGGGLRLTTRTQIGAAALTGAVLGYLLIGGFDLSNRAVPITPWSLPVMLAALAAAALGYSIALGRRVREARETIDPDTGVRALVIGKTLLMTGAVLAGGHLVYALRYVTSWSIEGPRERVIRGVVVALVAVVLALAGGRLERACVVPTDKDEDDDDAA